MEDWIPPFLYLELVDLEPEFVPPSETDEYRHWQVHDQLVDDDINTFERVGGSVAG